ncbi:MAG: HEAT repeat domain-containing protein [Isosphaeraceae bacterium]|nr:HEAT repeat domain-containing protein [Isosphaeraceae bacterium]
MNRILGAIALLVGGALASAGEHRLGDRTFVLPDGLTIERVASSPLVDRPITADFDERGFLYVADSSGSNENVQKQLIDRPHRIVRLEDSDHDGVYDRRTIFADKMMFPEGTMWFEGSLYVAAPPSIWKLTDTDGDGTADQRVEWYQGKTLTGCANDLHGPYRGPDGWIYWAKGAFARQEHSRGPGRPPLTTRAAHLFRARPDGSGIESVMTGGMDNPVDIAFTKTGERLFTTTFLQHPADGKRDGIIHAVYGGVYGKVHDVIDGHPRTRPEMMPTLVHLGPAAPCGLHRYEGRLLGKAFDDAVFACQFNLRKVSSHRLEASGSSYTTKDGELVSSPDQDFHPTDVLEDFDGSVLVVDTGGWYKLCCPTSQLGKPDVLGAIYRIKPIRHVAKHSAESIFGSLESASSATPAARLDDPDAAVRRRASDILAHRSDAVGLLGSQSTVEGKLAAIGIACRIDTEPARAIIRRYLDADEADVRHAACLSAGVVRDRASLPRLSQLVLDDEPAVRRAAAEAIGLLVDSPGELDRAGAADTLLRALETAEDRTLEHSITYALIQLGIADRAALERSKIPENPRARRGAILARDQAGAGGLDARLVAEESSSTDPITRSSMAWVLSRHPEWGGALAGILQARLESPPPGAEESDAIIEILVGLKSDRSIQEMLARVVRESKRESARSTALRAMVAASPEMVPRAWVDAVLAGWDAMAPSAILERLAVVRTWRKLGADEAAAIGSAISSVIGRLSPEQRLRALAALPAGRVLDPKQFSWLRSRLSEEIPTGDRLLALETIARSELDDAKLLELAEDLERVGPLELSKLLGMFEKSRSARVGMRLVEVLGRSASKASLRPDILKTLFANHGPAVVEAGAGLIRSLEVDASTQRARIDDLLRDARSGDVRRGQLVFNGTKAECRTCHTAGYVGGKVGPDLTRIGSVRDERDLLESILYPNLSFVRSYEPITIQTDDGRVVTGIPTKDGADEIVLNVNATEQARIPRSRIEEIRPGTVSVMPSGLDARLTRQELIDLVAFLRASK